MGQIGDGGEDESISPTASRYSPNPSVTKMDVNESRRASMDMSERASEESEDRAALLGGEREQTGPLVRKRTAADDAWSQVKEIIIEVSLSSVYSNWKQDR